MEMAMTKINFKKSKTTTTINAAFTSIFLIAILFSSSFVGLQNISPRTNLTIDHKAYAQGASLGTNLVNQIEMLDYYFPVITTSFFAAPGTQFSLDPSLYDGQPTFFFEVVMQSTQSGGTVTAQLFDKTSNTVVSGSTLSTGSTSPVRLRSAALSLSSSADEYVIQASTSSSSSPGILLSGRIIVQQSGATNTSVVIPIGNVALSLSGQPDGSSPMFSSSTNPTFIRQIAKIYHYNQTKYDGKLNLFFESVLSTTKFQRTASAYLFDLTTNSTVAGSQVSTSSFIPTRVRSGNLTLTNGHDYTFAISSSSSDAVAVSFASRIIVTQNGFTATEIPIRVANIFASVSTSSVNATTSISSINASAFTSPRFSFEADLFTKNSSLPVSANLFDTTKNLVISGSKVTSSNLVSTRIRADNISLQQTADEYITQLKGSGNLVTVNNGWVLVSMNLINRYTDIMNELGAIGNVSSDAVVTDFLNQNLTSLISNTNNLVSDSQSRTTLVSILNSALQSVSLAGNDVLALDQTDADTNLNNARSSINNYVTTVNTLSGTKIPTSVANSLVSQANQGVAGSLVTGSNVASILVNNPLTDTNQLFSRALNDDATLQNVVNSLISLGFKVTLGVQHHSPTVADILFVNGATSQVYDLVIPQPVLSMFATLGFYYQSVQDGTTLSHQQIAGTMYAVPSMQTNLANSASQSALAFTLWEVCDSNFTLSNCKNGLGNPNGLGAIFSVNSAGLAALIAVPIGILTDCLVTDICQNFITDLSAHYSSQNLQDFTNAFHPTLIVIVNVSNTHGGKASPSSFTVHVAGNNPVPSAFPGQNGSGTTVRLSTGPYVVTEDPLSGYTESIPSTGGCNSNMQPFSVMTCTITNSDVPPTPPPIFFDNFDDGPLASTGWSLPFSGCDTLSPPCLSQVSTNEYGQPAPSPPYWARLGILIFSNINCPPIFVSSSKSFTVSQPGNYQVTAVLSPSLCDICTEHAQVYLDNGLIFDAPGTTIFGATNPTIVNGNTVVNLAAGSHSVTMASTSNLACSGFFASYFDDPRIISTTNPVTPTPVGGPYFKLQVNQTSFNSTKPSTIVVPLKVIWNQGYSAEPVSAKLMGNTTSVVPSITSVMNTTSYQLFNVNLSVPSNTQTGRYVVGIYIIEPDGDYQFVPLFVRVQ
jgi:hypothetical protein